MNNCLLTSKESQIDGMENLRKIDNKIPDSNAISKMCRVISKKYTFQPLPGALFQKFRDQIMGVVPAQDPGPGKAITKIDESNTHTVKPTKAYERQ